jgi:putative ABC transport system permease protein
MNSLLLDVQSALRFFARRKAAFSVILLTMALALGANTAVFSVLKAFLFSSLGFPAADRVMAVWTVRQIDGRGPVNFLDAHVNLDLMRKTTRFWQSLGATFGTDLNWQLDDGETRRLQGARAQATFFQVMQVQPVLGRLFTAAEEGPRAAPVAVISASLWHSVFNRAPDVLGRSIRLNGEPHTVIGVMPEGFAQPQGVEIWLPYDLPAAMWTNVVGARQLNCYARLAPDVTPAQAIEELRAFTPRAIEAYPDNKNWTWTVQPLREALLSGADRTVLFVQAGAAVLLLLAISNLASLLLAWAAERQRETAVRLALGASTWRLVRQFLLQSLLLVSLGGLAGVALAAAALPVIRQLSPGQSLGAFLDGLRLDTGTLGFATLLVLGTGLLAGLLPALQARRTSFLEALRSDSRGATLSRDGLRWQQAMIVLQAAVSVLILTGAGLAGLGLLRLSRVDLGFRTENRAAFQVQFPEPAYAAQEKRAQFVRELELNLAREPLIRGFAFTGSLPVGDGQWGGAFVPQRANGEFDLDAAVLHFRRVSPGYLKLMGTPLLEGRLLTERDTATSPHVAVISRSVAEKFWPGTTALGRKLRRTAQKDAPLVEVVGVVANARDAGAAAVASDAIYMPWDQISMRRGWVVLEGENTAELLAAGRRALHATAPDVAAYNPGTLADFAWRANALPRLQMVLLGVFAVIATGITALGSYGVMSQLVANREKEMAIRAALGASRGMVLRQVLGQNARLAATGTLLGLVLAWFGARALQAQLAGFDASAIWPYLAVAGLVLGLTQAASFIPARRAARLDVQKALAGA